MITPSKRKTIPGFLKSSTQSSGVKINRPNKDLNTEQVSPDHKPIANVDLQACLNNSIKVKMPFGTNVTAPNSARKGKESVVKVGTASNTSLHNLYN